MTTTICELPPGERVLYRILGPLIIGGCILSMVSLVSSDKAGDLWFRLGVAGGMMAFMLWLSSRISRVNLRVVIGPDGLQVRRLFSGKELCRPLSDIDSVKFNHDPAGVSTCRIFFRDGTSLDLDGNFGPGARHLLLAYGRY